MRLTGFTWDETLFAGAAKYYDRGRLPYAPGLADAMAEALGLDGTGRLLDVGCGPGTVALRFAHLFEAVVGVDADGDMLTEGARIAAEREIANASWVRLLAEELPAGLGAFRVITFAASFHWMDRGRVARIVRGMLEPGGALVHVDNRHQVGVAPEAGLPHPPPPAEVSGLIARYLGPRRRAGLSFLDRSPDNEATVFRAVGFEGPDQVNVPDGRLLTRTIDDIVANTFSSSFAAPHLFGERVEEFETDLRALLRRASPTGQFSVRLADNVLNIWRPV